MMSIVDNARFTSATRFFPIDYTVEPRPLSKTNDEYIEHAVKLGEKQQRKCLERANLKPEEIDLNHHRVVHGFMIPSLDAHLIKSDGFSFDVRRMAFTELAAPQARWRWGGRAAEFLKARPGGNVLIIAVELPSLTFQRKDISQANLISSILLRRRGGRGGQPETGRAGRRSSSRKPTRSGFSGAMDSILKIPVSTSCWPRTSRK